MARKRMEKRPRPPRVVCPENPHVFLQHVMMGKPIPHVKKEQILTPAGKVLREEVVVEDYYPTIHERFEAARILSRSIPPPPEMTDAGHELKEKEAEALEKAKGILIELTRSKSE